MAGDGVGFTCRALWALRDSDLGEADWKAAVGLVSCCDAKGTCYYSTAKLAKRARMSKSGFKEALRRLEGCAGPLVVTVTRDRKTSDGDQDTHFYRVSFKSDADSVGWAVADPTPITADPTPVVTDPTVGRSKPDGWAVADPTGGPPQTPEEDSRKRTVEEDKEEGQRSRRWRRVPKHWQPRTEHRQLAAERGVNFADELANFRDYEFNTPKTDADACFRSWLRKSKAAPAATERPKVDPRAVEESKRRYDARVAADRQAQRARDAAEYEESGKPVAFDLSQLSAAIGNGGRGRAVG